MMIYSPAVNTGTVEGVQVMVASRTSSTEPSFTDALRYPSHVYLELSENASSHFCTAVSALMVETTEASKLIVKSKLSGVS